MPKYYFHVKDTSYCRDEDGVVLPDDAAARAEGIVAAGQMISALDAAFWRDKDWSMEVMTETGDVVCKMQFSGRTD